MKPNLLSSLLLLFFLLCWCSVATDDSQSEVDQVVQKLPQLLPDHPLHGLNVTVKLNNGSNSRGEKEIARQISKKSSSGGKGAGRSAGAGSQSIRQPRSNTKSSSPSILHSCSSSLLRIGFPCLLLFLALT
ncbi:hypothetical protein Cni_G26084 [Canna indica]|uniref:Uncharacterized protein n=1 Tax=Canna indica TaxID=4628 RepID=A0AAQ3QPY5_9LILI|nr:hypothetical protein Cni_G26084 [Canna indica]